MKAYNLNAASFGASFGDVECIKLGEDGRNRKLTLVNCPKGIKDGELVSLFLPKVGKPSIKLGGENDGTWLMRISSEGSYVRGANGNIRVLNTHRENVKVVARGHGAFGAAGNTGTWDDLLLTVKENTVLRVKPSRGDAYYLHVLEDRVLTLKSSDLDVYDFPISENVEDYARL